MDATSFLNAKYKWLFGFFDVDGNGTLERSDFQARANRATEAVKNHFENQENGSQILQRHLNAIHQAQSTTYNKLFDMLLASIDKAGDNKISFQEWIEFCRLIKREVDHTGRLPKWFEDLLTYYFSHTLDFNGNGKIDFYELSFMGDAPHDVTWYCFDKLTNSNAIPLDQNLFVEMSRDYMASTDVNSKSRYIFGFVEGAESRV